MSLLSLLPGAYARVGTHYPDYGCVITPAAYKALENSPQAWGLIKWVYDYAMARNIPHPALVEVYTGHSWEDNYGDVIIYCRDDATHAEIIAHPWYAENIAGSSVVLAQAIALFDYVLEPKPLFGVTPGWKLLFAAPRLQLTWLLTAAYAYYCHDYTIMSDTAYDSLAASVLANYTNGCYAPCTVAWSKIDFGGLAAMSSLYYISEWAEAAKNNAKKLMSEEWACT